MTEEEKQAEETAIATVKQTPLVVTDDGSVSHLLDSGKFAQMQRVAALMASASLIPEHLRKGSKDQTLANCFLVVNQAIRWGLDPFSVAPETYAVGGKLAFQGKLIAAVVNARAGLNGRLQYDFTGTPGTDGFAITVSGEFINEPGNVRQITLSVKQAKTKNAMWTNDPEQKLVYSGAIKWARRHAPEAMLGVLTDDDLDRMDESGALDVDGLGKRAKFAAMEPPAVLPPPESEPADAPQTDADRFEEAVPQTQGSLLDGHGGDLP